MISPTSPLVTVTFVAWQRRDALARGIASCRAQDYPQLEILVLDNSPTDAIHRWLLETHPEVKSIKTAKPIALPAARNLLMATAAGEYVFFHDDDSYFSSPDNIRTAIEYIRDKPNVGGLAFRVGDGQQDWNPQFDAPEAGPVYNYIACGVVFRRRDFLGAGGYFEEFWLYGEERILSLGMFGIGRELHFTPKVAIIHTYEGTGRPQDNARRYWTCDVVMIAGAALLKFPLVEALLWYPVLLAYYTLQVAITRRRPLVALHALSIALRMLPIFLKRRAPIPRREYRRWRATRQAQQRAYLQRCGRWAWYHSVLPAVG